jgi:hypothetical protein
MGIKIIQGQIGRGQFEPTQKTATATPNAAQETARAASPQFIAQASAQVSSTLARSSDATVTSLRVTGNQIPNQKLRDPKEAADLARDIADRIRFDEEEGEAAHARLDTVRSRDHIV